MNCLKILTFLLLFPVLLTAQDVILVEYASGFVRPVDIVHAGDDRLFVVERNGRIKIIDGNGDVLSTLFLDISSQVTSSNSNQDERGLLGLAFHPDYIFNGFFYVNYINNSGDTRISRFTVDTDNPNVADPNSEVILMTIDQPFGNHNGGGLKFGPDGYLYIGLGDGGSFDDPGNRSQNPQTLLGKMLRIDVNSGNPYAIPPDNPFVNDNSTLDEIWALGLRNPWRYSFDRMTGDLWMGDVGQGQWEEIDFEPAGSSGGLNYGWRCYEGDQAYITGGCDDASAYTLPAHDYNHNGFTHCSVTGGFVYWGCEFPDLQGHYIYADYCSGRFWSLTPDGTGGWTNQEVGSYPGYDISTFGEGVDGELYTARLGQGRIYKITTDMEFTVEIVAGSGLNTLEAPAGFESYQWYMNGEIISTATSDILIFTEGGSYTVEVTTANGCTYLSEPFIGVVGIEELESFEAFTASPNPFREVLTLNMEVNRSTDIVLEVLDIDGKVVFSKKQTVNGTASEDLNLKHLSAGVYFVHVKTAEGTLSRKVVKY